MLVPIIPEIRKQIGKMRSQDKFEILKESRAIRQKHRILVECTIHMGI